MRFTSSEPDAYIDPPSPVGTLSLRDSFTTPRPRFRAEPGRAAVIVALHLAAMLLVAAVHTAWWRFAHRVSGRPWPYLVGAVLVLLAFAAPAFAMQTAWPAAGDAPRDTTYRQAYDLLDEGFGPGVSGPLLVVVDLSVPGVSADDVPGLAEDVSTSSHIASVSAPLTSEDGSTVVFSAVPTTGPADLETSVAIAEP